ncbi:unnamed protein product [Nezara viridula]|uniref:Uncharacterized protein n=1 Tax=Nezara viridula TaxID=85310 RepID=A0A9P0H7T8_NEZVI|nr:unnamed protein product [Nezara viridula]
MLCYKTLKYYGRNNSVKSIFSRSFSNFRGSYKIVNRGSPEGSDDATGTNSTESNWELFKPEGFRFFLPGSIGLGWHDDVSLKLLTSGKGKFELKDFHFEVQDCPSLLRAGFQELFPVPEVLGFNVPITVVKVSLRKPRLCSDEDAERFSKQFVCIAEQICRELKMAGFWADFINPFSGLARYTNNHSSGDEAISYLESLTEDCGQCQVISFRDAQTPTKLIGTIYTNATRETAIVKKFFK